MEKTRITGTCADCGASIWIESTWCRKCAARRRVRRTNVCQDCGGPVSRHDALRCRGCHDARGSLHETCQNCGGWKGWGSVRCWACTKAARQRTNVCQDCGGPVSSSAVLRCRRCYDQQESLHEVCPDCGGWKGWGSARCQKCDALRRQSRQVDWRQVVMPFDAAAFMAELARADLEWSVDQLSAASSVSMSTIRRWLRGVHKPSRTELEAVVAVLAFERCTGCSGLGYVDPGHLGRQALLDRVTKQRPAPLPLPPSRKTRCTGDGWALDRNTLWLTVADSRVRLTPQESRVLATLADAGGHFVSAAQIGAAVSISDDAVRTNLTRIRDKFNAAGADFGAVVEHSRGAGYRARMAVRTEVSA